MISPPDHLGCLEANQCPLVTGVKFIMLNVLQYMYGNMSLTNREYLQLVITDVNQQHKGS